MSPLRASRERPQSPNFSIKRTSVIRHPTSSSPISSSDENSEHGISSSGTPKIQSISEGHDDMNIDTRAADPAPIAQYRTPNTTSGFDSSDNTRPLTARRRYIGVAETTQDEHPTMTTIKAEGASEPVLHIGQMDFGTPLSERSTMLFPTSTHKAGFAQSVTSMSDSTSHASGAVAPAQLTTGSRMPEFFGQTVFQTVLCNPTITHQLLLFAQSRLCGENLAFLDRVRRYQTLLTEVSTAVYDIHKDFIASSAPTQINVAESVLLQVNKEMKSALTSTIPALEAMFSAAQADVERLVYTDIYPNFVRHQMSVSAAKALGGDSGKYAGLGDCFVLTDPAKADNPIVYASDGFVKVTGYYRNEIIPRNCRFLQGQHTERAAVQRIKDSVEKRQESVELILNHKKNGEPFWNLLYTTPLYDGQGKVVFFLGGQVNCSTAIHSASDVLRILGQPSEARKGPVPDKDLQRPMIAKPSRSRTVLNALLNSKPSVQAPTAGMENRLLHKMSDMPFANQLDAFYTAYSNYLIINYSSFLITFASGSVIDLLFPVKARPQGPAPAVGTDAFKYLGLHCTSGSLSWDFKSAVKTALKSGQPISLELKLCAKPYMGFERFLLHWTPLKDEEGVVAWVVLTLGSVQRE
ncbi:hypothetical protein LTR62_004925 [Meristemomyces frigidus]|uniref:RGS domain-containing protein n=1 Tax=Meristemomyces frigidus TaxID=1508187 RepID=A0AAN7YNU2_9PEZI|nr:hypothetical protein LTR62_004925 [Meristemomyces frigidus]